MNPHKILGHVQVYQFDEINKAVEFDRGNFLFKVIKFV